jgi:6-pyruvoyltetrahydropterin/6-carboxytetrahydropterin synthase
MHRLVRNIRFSINPFLPDDELGANSYASKPCGRGLSLFFELIVGLAGQTKEDTGFVLNVSDIDRLVRAHAVPIFADRIRENFARSKHISLPELTRLLARVRDTLKDKFASAMLIELTLKLNPYRKIAFDCEDMKMFYFSEKFDFAAMHKLWNDKLSQKENFELFGKCANPAGHGHNYVLEVTIKAPTEQDIRIGDFENIVDAQFVKLVDHKNLNQDVADFAEKNPTIENLAVLAWDRLVDKFSQAKLHSITVWESDRTFCTYYG